MKKVLIILGPTATGKTNLGLELAKKFNGQLVACDSRQVYQGLDIGTGKLPVQNANLQIKKQSGFWEIDGIKVWMYDLVNLKSQFSVFEFKQQASSIILELIKSGKLPIVVGGTGLYLKALLGNLDNIDVPPDQKLRVELATLSLGELQDRVGRLSPTRWQKLNQSDRKNPRRLSRIIEQISMYPYINKVKNSEFNVQNYDLLKIGLTAPRSDLSTKINQQVLDWFKDGIIAEVQSLIEGGVPKKRFKELGLEYALIADFLNQKNISQEELKTLIQAKIRQYAKRQQTWFKKEKEVNWFDVTRDNWTAEVESLVTNWYNPSQE